MQHLKENGGRPRIGRALAKGGAALLFAAVLLQSGLAHAAHGGGHGGGGFHGGGFHAGGFHGGRFAGFHGGGFHQRWHGSFASLHRDGFGRDRWEHGWRDGRYGWWWGDGLGWTYYPDYGYYDGSQYASQYWYYCSDPAGYYPYVAQCNTGWQTVPTS